LRRENCFVAALAMKQSNEKWQQFERYDFCRRRIGQ
jgi:hypothetical protein